jgi:hypothetical protein
LKFFSEGDSKTDMGGGLPSQDVPTLSELVWEKCDVIQILRFSSNLNYNKFLMQNWLHVFLRHPVSS